MNVRKLFMVLALVGVMSAVVMAASIDGKWKSEMPGRDGNPQVTTYAFKTDGDTLTGTITNQRGDTAISDGKVTGDEISFVVVRAGRDGNQMKIQYKGKVSGDELKLSMQMGPDAPPREIVAKREK
jgi:hypothetical protein